MRILIALVCISFLFSCNKEEADPWQYNSPQELESNYLELRDNSFMLTTEDKAQILSIDANTLIVKKQGYEEIKEGDVLINTAMDETDTLAFYKKILAVQDEGNNLRFITTEATLPEAYKRYYISSRFDKTELKTRNLVTHSLAVNGSFGPISTTATISPLIPNLQGGFTYNDLSFTSSYDEAAGTQDNLFGPARFDMQIEGLRFDASFSMELGGKVEAKLEELGPPVFFFPIGPTGLSFYLMPKFELNGSFEGNIKSPTYAVNDLIGPYNVHMTYQQDSGLYRQEFLPAPPTSQVNADTTWTVTASGNVELKIGAEAVIAVTGTQNFAKCGFFLFFYLDPTISKKGDFEDKCPRISFDNKIGFGAQAFAEFNFFGGNDRPAGLPWFFPDQGKAESPDARFSIYEQNQFSFPLCGKFTQASIEYLGNNLVVSASRPAGSGFFLRINGELLNGGEIFAFDQSHTISLPPLANLINTLDLVDAIAQTCYISTLIADPSLLPTDCDGTVSDGDGNQYCTKIIGNRMWMAENYRYEGSDNLGVVYGNPTGPELVSKERLFGRLYTFEEVSANFSNSLFQQFGNNVPEDYSTSTIQGICPNGWRLPNQSDWDDLINSSGGFASAGKNIKLNSRLAWATGNLPAQTSFGAVAGGEYYQYSSDPNEQFGFFGKKGFIWSGDFTFSDTYVNSIFNTFQVDETDFATNAGLINSGNQNCTSCHTGTRKTVGGLGYSCRCVKDL